MVSNPHPHLCSNYEPVILKKVGMGMTNSFLPSSSILCRWRDHAWALVVMLLLYGLWRISLSHHAWWQQASQTLKLGNQGSTLQTRYCTPLGQLVGTKRGHLTCLRLSNLMCLMLLSQESLMLLESWTTFPEGHVWPCMWETMGDAVWSGTMKC